jgi:predicted peptidase
MTAKTLLALACLATALPAEPEAKTFKADDGTEVLYRFAAPEKPKEGETYPLVLFLHGAGERGADNKAQLKHGVKDILKGAADLGEPVYLIAPQCPPGRWWADGGEKDPLPAAVLALVEETAKSHPVNRKRIYITGLSMGGFGTFAMLARSPGTWAAAIPICGAGDPKSAEKFKRVPIRIFHGDADTTVAPDGSKNMAEALKKAGADVELTIYPGVGHNSWTQTYRDPEVIKWLFSQKKSN